MTTPCDPNLVANPAVFDDPVDGGQLLYWSCCNRSWVLSPSVRKERQRTYQAWHFAAEALKPVT